MLFIRKTTKVCVDVVAMSMMKVSTIYSDFYTIFVSDQWTHSYITLWVVEHWKLSLLMTGTTWLSVIKDLTMRPSHPLHSADFNQKP